MTVALVVSAVIGLNGRNGFNLGAVGLAAALVAEVDPNGNVDAGLCVVSSAVDAATAVTGLEFDKVVSVFDMTGLKG